MSEPFASPAIGEPGASPLVRRRDPRLVAYTVVGVTGLLAGLALGRAEVVVLAAPFVLLAIAGVVLADPPTVAGTVTLDPERLIEGDAVDCTICVATGRGVERVEIAAPVRRPGPGPVTRLAVCDRPDPRGEVRLERRLGTDAWGVVRVGPVHLRLHAPLGLVRWETTLPSAAAARVLPPARALRQLMGPAEPRIASGTHRSPRRGEGFEFAEVRPYTPGDRLRSLNWSVTSRRRSPWVNQRHPERMADVVLVVDTFSDDPSGSAPGLVPAVRAAWLLAASHLRAQDRVGLVAFGGFPAWLPPGGGDRARYALLDRFLTLQATWTEAQRSAQLIPPRVVPAGALLVALTPLHDDRTARALADLRGRGLEVVALAIDVTDELAPPPGPGGALAARVWRLDRARRVEQLEAAGVPVVAWDPARTSVPDAVLALSLRLHRPTRAGAPR